MTEANRVYQKISEVLIEALDVEQEEILPTAILSDDLGAESIDYLDIVFRLEREFGIRIPRNALFPESISQEDHPEYVQGGKLTALGIASLKERLPDADNIEALIANYDGVIDCSNLFTVQYIINYITRRLAVI